MQFLLCLTDLINQGRLEYREWYGITLNKSKRNLYLAKMLMNTVTFGVMTTNLPRHEDKKISLTYILESSHEVLIKELSSFLRLIRLELRDSVSGTVMLRTLAP
jgi:transcriptional antiterminator